MSYSKEFYFDDEEDSYYDQCVFCSPLEDKFKSQAGKGVSDEFYKVFDFEERQILKRIVSTKEPAHKIARRIGWTNYQIACLLLRAVARQDEFQREQELKVQTPKRRPSFGCGHLIIGKPSDGCLQCNDAELAEITKHDLPHSTILNLHNPEEPDDV